MKPLGFRGILLCAVVLLMAILPQAHAFIPGDVNGDGRVAIDDVQFALKAALGFISLNSPQTIAADLIPIPGKAGNLYGDGAVRIDDVLQILRISLGLAELPQGSISVRLENGEAVFEWSGGEGTYTVTFRQQNKSITKKIVGAPKLVISSSLKYNGATKTFESDYAPFKDFGPDLPVVVSVSSGVEPSGLAGALQFAPLRHAPSEYRRDWLKLDAEPPYTAPAGTITVRGRALQPLRVQAYLTPPSGIPVKLKLQMEDGRIEDTVFGPTLAAGSRFLLSFKLAEPGVHMVEILHYTGEAALNQPIYVGGVPLLPSYVDVRTPASGEPLSLETARAEWLSMVNADRLAHGLRQLVPDDLLNSVAQAYAEDMKARGFLSHVSPEGKTASDRVRWAGAPEVMRVAENLALDTSVSGLHEGLMYSGAHRASILSIEWSRIGLGIVKREDGAIIGVQLLASYPGEAELPRDAFDQVLMDTPLQTAFRAGSKAKISGSVEGNAGQITLFFNTITGDRTVLAQDAPVVNGRFEVTFDIPAGLVGEYYIGLSVDEKPSKVFPVVVK